MQIEQNRDMSVRRKTGMQFVWLSVNHQEWDDLLRRCPQANWMQSYPYARAIYARDFKSTRFAKIQKNGRDVGVVAVQEIRLGPIHFVEIYRGPLWFESEVLEEDLKEFAMLLRVVFPQKFLCRFRWFPEWPFSQAARLAMQEAGMNLRAQTFETVEIDLTQSLKKIRDSFHAKWRNCLCKAEQQGLQIHIDRSAKGITQFLKSYNQFKQIKDFHGPSCEFMKEEFYSAERMQQALLVTAAMNGEEIAGVMLIIHGCNASYRLGWNSVLGKRTNAHYLLLWTAICQLQELKINKFDLGGVKTKEAPALTHFKKRTGGKYLQLLGQFS